MICVRLRLLPEGFVVDTSESIAPFPQLGIVRYLNSRVPWLALVDGSCRSCGEMFDPPHDQFGEGIVCGSK
jgi:hypothetical protein